MTVRKTGGTTDPYANISTIEKQALRGLGGPPVRRVQLLQARIDGAGRALRVPAALVEVGSPDDLLDIQPRRRAR
jgi:hypothetical protein